MKAADACELMNGSPVAFHFTNFFPSSLPDLMIFMNLQLQGALGHKTPLLSTASFKGLHTPHSWHKNGHLEAGGEIGVTNN